MEVTFVRGLQSTPRQLALPVERPGRIDRTWESFSPGAQERVLRVLASAIARIIKAEQQEDAR
jgi:hypothetical protein